MKLPSINLGRPSSQDKKRFEIRRSSSKGKNDSSTVSQITQNTRGLTMTIEGQRVIDSERIKKRPSLGKKLSAQE